MRVVIPLEITDAMLVSSTASEPEAGSPSTENPWTAVATYPLGAIVIDIAYHRKYESLQAININHALPAYPETETDWWIDVGPTNKWAMFDLYRNTQTELNTTLTVVIAPGVRINTVGLLGLSGASVSISLDAVGSPSLNYYTYSIDLATRDVRNWYDYFFDEFSTRDQVIRYDVPPYASTRLTVSIVGDEPKCGGLVIGSYEYLGEAQREASFELVQFSIIERDAFGTATLIPRRSIPTTEQRLLLDKAEVDNVVDTLRDLDAVPALWSGVDDQDHPLVRPMTILGIYRRARFKLADPDCELNLTLEEI